MKKKALITGINGQDGGYLCELLIEKGYQVSGIARGVSPLLLRDDVDLFRVNITDFEALSGVIRDVRPDEVYNLAAQSDVRISFEQPLVASQTVGLGAANLFEAVRIEHPSARVFQASSSEMFGDCLDDDGFQRETTPMNPISPYACAKLFAYNVARSYRIAYKLFISNGILFNHESPRRGTGFVTSKICREAVRIKYALTDKLELGNTDARRDWGHAKDYVRAMWMILQVERPDDFVCATGITHTVSDIAKHVCHRLELDMNGLLQIDSELFRPEDPKTSKGDSTKLRAATGWKPEYSFETMLDEMIDHWLVELDGSKGIDRSAL